MQLCHIVIRGWNHLDTTQGLTVLCRNGSNLLSQCDTTAFGTTLQLAYENGNTITTSTGRDIALTLTGSLATSTSFSLTNAGTAKAFIINDTNASSGQTSFEVQSGG